jgi:hypothetical protein
MKEKTVKIISLIYLVAGVAYFGFFGDGYSVLNFIFAFLIVFVNFVYLEKLTAKVIGKDRNGAILIIMINLIRYPLIGLLLFAIINWNNFEKIPFMAGLSAVVAGLLIIPFVGGKKQDES